MRRALPFGSRRNEGALTMGKPFPDGPASGTMSAIIHRGSTTMSNVTIPFDASPQRAGIPPTEVVHTLMREDLVAYTWYLWKSAPKRLPRFIRGFLWLITIEFFVWFPLVIVAALGGIAVAVYFIARAACSPQSRDDGVPDNILWGYIVTMGLTLLAGFRRSGYLWRMAKHSASQIRGNAYLENGPEGCRSGQDRSKVDLSAGADCVRLHARRRSARERRRCRELPASHGSGAVVGSSPRSRPPANTSSSSSTTANWHSSSQSRAFTNAAAFTRVRRGGPAAASESRCAARLAGRGDRRAATRRRRRRDHGSTQHRHHRFCREHSSQRPLFRRGSAYRCQGFSSDQASGRIHPSVLRGVAPCC